MSKPVTKKAMFSCSEENCVEKAAVKVKYLDKLVCKEHFLRFIEQRALRAIEEYHFIEQEGEKWGVAMSGGKDSQVLATVLAKALKGRIKLAGIYIDVGIHGNSYTDLSRKCVEDTCKQLGMECVIVDTQSTYQICMDDAHIMNHSMKKYGKSRSDCSSCGIMKRYLINKAAVDCGCSKVTTGHHLTDEVTTILANVLNMNLQQLTRPRPWDRIVASDDDKFPLLPRIKPLIEISEEETTLYAFHGNLTHVNIQCPFSVDSPLLFLKGHILDLERKHPGTMLKMFKGYQKRVLPALKTGAEIKKRSGEVNPAQKTNAEEEDLPEQSDHILTSCSRCGYPTTATVCGWCRMADSIVSYKNEHPDKFKSFCKCAQCNSITKHEMKDVEEIVEGQPQQEPRVRKACPRCKRPGHPLEKCHVVENKNTSKWDLEHPDEIPLLAIEAIKKAKEKKEMASK